MNRKLLLITGLIVAVGGLSAGIAVAAGAGGGDDAAPERPQALEDQCERDHRSEDQRPDRPARGLDDGPHGASFLRRKLPAM